MGYNVNEDITNDQQYESWFLYVAKAKEAGIYNIAIQIMEDKINNYNYER
jgi:hypothetical protein